MPKRVQSQSPFMVGGSSPQNHTAKNINNNNNQDDRNVHKIKDYLRQVKDK